MIKVIKKTVRSIRNRTLHSIGLMTHRRRMTPDFLIIGAQKGGTSSLFYYLKFHPEIIRPIKKEIHFYNIHYQKGLKWYQAHFPLKSESHITGEASPDYIFHPLSAQRIKALNPEMKIIVLLRNPIQRAYSAFQMNKRMGIDPRDNFEEAVQYELENDKGVEQIYDYDKHNFFYLARGKYAKQLAVWKEHFSDNQFHIIQSDVFFKDSKEELQKVYKFLGIKQILPTDYKAMNIGKYPPMSETLYDKLKSYFKEDLIQLKAEWQIELEF